MLSRSVVHKFLVHRTIISVFKRPEGENKYNHILFAFNIFMQLRDASVMTIHNMQKMTTLALTVT